MSDQMEETKTEEPRADTLTIPEGASYTPFVFKFGYSEDPEMPTEDTIILDECGHLTVDWDRLERYASCSPINRSAWPVGEDFPTRVLAHALLALRRGRVISS